jgi:uncharacterized protein YkwD
MDRGTRRPAGPGRWAGFLLFGVVALAVLIGGGLYVTRGAFSSHPTSMRATMTPRDTGAGGLAGMAGMAVAATPTMATLPSPTTAARTRPTGIRPSQSASATGRASAQPSASASASASTSPPATQDATAAAQVLALINQARSAAGLPALTVTSGLEASSSAHNLRMADGCGLSHQCQGEPPIGDRETAAGVHWTAAGENIGDGTPEADTAAAIAQLAVGLTQSMLNEKPPDDGHRLNILSSTFTHIGIAVYRDGSGTVWLTQDFSN